MMKSYAHPSFTREQWVASASSSVEESPIVNKLARRPVFEEEEVATQVNCYTRHAAAVWGHRRASLCVMSSHPCGSAEKGPSVEKMQNAN